MGRQVTGVDYHLDILILRIRNVCTWFEKLPDIIYDVFLRIVVSSNSFEQ